MKLLSLTLNTDISEWNFFLRGPTVFKDKQLSPYTWISDSKWNIIVEMDNNLPTFRGIVSSFNIGKII